MKERLTGAIILVALIVLLVPELLTGPIRPKSASVPAASAAPAAAPLRSYTLTLGAAQPADATPAAAQVPAQPSQDAKESGPQVSGQAPAQSAVDRPAKPQKPDARAPEPAATPAEPAQLPKHSAGAGPDLQAARAPAHPAMREARKAGSSGGWVVQLGSFASRQNADRLAHSLAVKGVHMSVSPARAGSRVLWRVRAGPARDRAGAQRLAARLRALGHRGELLPVR